MTLPGRSYSSGHVSGGMLKAMLKHLDLAKGKKDASAWLEATRMERQDFDDESRTVPIQRLHVALKAFVDLAGPAAIDAVRLHLLDPDNLGRE